MRIVQGRVYLNFFRNGFLKKYKLEPIIDSRKPAIFYGCWPSQYNQVLSYKGDAVIIFCGSDAMELQKNPLFVNQLRRKSNISIIAESNFISADLDKAGLKHTCYPVTPFTFECFLPCPLGKKIFFYAGHDPEKLKFYGGDIIERIRPLLPQFEFITLFSKLPDHVPREQMPSIYKECFIGLRLVPHDGMSVSVIEMGMMGRRVVWNGNSPNAIPWNSDQDVINAILSESKKIGQTDLQLSASINEFINQPAYFLETSKKTAEMSTKKYGCSVIINTVNEDKTLLRRAIASYKAQSNIDLELIISTIPGDSSIEIGNETGCKIVISETKGIYQQLNNAIQYITKPWYAYASGNDTALPMKLFTEIDMAVKTGKKVCYSAFYTQNFNSVVKMVRRFHDYSFEKHLEGNFVNDCAVISTDLLKKYAPFNLEWGNFAYWDLWLRIFKGEGNVFVYNPSPTWNYFVNPQSLHIKRQKESAEYMEVYNKLRSSMLNSHITPSPAELEKEDGPSIDIVFPYAIEGNKIDELKHALRSIAKNAQFNYRIVIVGDAPKWLNDENVLYIPHSRETGKNSKLKDSIAKMKLICSTAEITENFIYWYDDIYLLKPINLEFFNKSFYKNIVKPDWKGSTLNQKYLQATAEHLRSKQNFGEVYNGECHIPRIYNKAKMIEILNWYFEDENSFLINTLYLNHFHQKLTVLSDRIKAGFYGFAGNGSWEATENVQGQVLSSILLNHDDNGLNDHLKSFIKSTFADKCDCEK